MCRHLAYLGPPLSLAELLLEPDHSLLEQSWAPGDMRGGGTVNADGFGVGWWRAEGTVGTYRNGAPMWTDTAFPQLATDLRSSAVVAAVRSATVGMPVNAEVCAPLTDGTWLFSHNGKVSGWPHSLAGLAARLDPAELLGAQPTDSAVLWALLKQRLDTGAEPGEAVAELVREVHAVAPDSRLNLLLGDGHRIIATTWTHSLWVCRQHGAVTVASEPFGPSRQWVEIPDHCLLIADTEHTEVVSLGGTTVREAELTVRFTEADAEAELRGEVREGLTDEPKWLSPKWFYDAVGSELFERITELDEYYQTRAEHRILQRTALTIAELTNAATLVELGSGSSEKTRLLLNALDKHGTLRRFVPLDVSESALRSAVAAIETEYPELEVAGVVDDFTTGRLDAGEGRLVAFLGGTIGNLLPEERAEFFTALRAAMRPGESLLLGTDLVKQPARLVRAYDDAAGVTAEFNRNVLRVLNERLGADFDPTAFEHVALWNDEQEWIEMRLRARRPMHVRVAELDLDVDFAEGEEIRTEISAKFRRNRIADELAVAGFELGNWWLDDAGEFALSLSIAR